MTWSKVSEIAAASAGAAKVERCPKCGHGPRLESSYQFAGMAHDDSYCGSCGANWSMPSPAFDARKAQAGDKS